MPELPLNPTLLKDLEAAYDRNVEMGRVTPDTAHDLGATAAAAASENRQANGNIGLGDLDLTPKQQNIVESLHDQSGQSVLAYGYLIQELGIEGTTAGYIYNLFEAKLVDWAKNGTLDYVNESMEADPDLSFSLVISPNEVVSKAELYFAAHRFANGQDKLGNGTWEEAHIFKELCDQYSEAELSGRPQQGLSGDTPPARFTLIPSKYTAGVPVTNVPAQWDAFQKYITEQTKDKSRPDMALKIPSVLDGVAWWYTLREQQREESGDSTKQLDAANLDSAGLRHIDLDIKRIDGTLMALESSVGADNRPGFYVSIASIAQGMRVAIG